MINTDRRGSSYRGVWGRCFPEAAGVANRHRSYSSSAHVWTTSWLWRNYSRPASYSLKIDVIPPWKTFGLDSRRPALDKFAADLASGRKRASSSRRKLGESTKKFKRNLSKTPGAEQTGKFKSLLKTYQEEIDLLTKGCRASDNGFLGLYRGLYAVADPV